MAFGKLLSSFGGGDILGFAGGLLGNKSASDEARKQRDWATEMSNTEMTRRVADLKNAGLNPMLAVGHLGGASNSGGAVARQENPLASGVALRQQRLLNEALINKNSAEAAKAAAETTESSSRTAINYERIAEIIAQTDLFNSAAGLNRLRGDESRSKTSLNEQQWIHRTQTMPLDEKIKALELAIKQLSMPQHMAESNAWATSMGQNFRPWFRDLFGGGSPLGLILNRAGPKTPRKKP